MLYLTHAEIGSHAHIGGATAVHQYCRIGAYAMVGAMIFLKKDVLPFFLVAGNPVLHYKLNTVGLRRQNFSAERLQILKQAQKIFRNDIQHSLESLPQNEDIVSLIEWRKGSPEVFIFLSILRSLKKIMIKTITGDSFQKEVLQSEIPVLVDFWAEGCGPCETVASMLEKLNQEQAASKKISIAKLDVIQNQEIAMQYQVMQVPTLILFDKGEIKQKIVGADTEAISKIFEK